jgi:CRP/FNR family transcriptional regulator, nitrogen oxide reductase regulator
MPKRTEQKRTTPRVELAKMRPERLPKIAIPILDGLRSSDVKEVLAASHLLKVGPKEVLCSANEPALNLFVLVHGRVKYSQVTPRGEEIILRVMTPTEGFGFTTLLSNPPNYLGTAESLVQSELLVWEHKNILPLAARYPQIMSNTLRITLSYLGNLIDRHSNLFDGTASNRIARVLVDLCRRTGAVDHKGIDVNITNEHLGSLADASRFTVSRTLNKWHKQHVISKSRESVRIHSPEALLAKSPTRA